MTNMKNVTTTATKIVSTFAIASALSFQPVLAGEETYEVNRHKHALTTAAGGLIGALLGGPIGFMAGIYGGAQMSQSDINKEESLFNASNTIDELQTTVADQRYALSEMEKGISKQLQFQVMFSTGNDKLTESEVTRIETLARYLSQNAQLNVRLDGHADKRGTEEYNNVLSQERALHVAEALKAYGIAESRIEVYSHGSNYASPEATTHDELAFDRRVDIKVFAEDMNNEVVSSN